MLAKESPIGPHNFREAAVGESMLETGMVFNVEPAVYIEGYGGLRHCSMIAVTPQGVEVLTPFQSELPDLICGK